MKNNWVKTISVKQQQRALLMNQGKVEKILTPGKHNLWFVQQRKTVHSYDLEQVVFSNRASLQLYNDTPMLKQVWQRVDMSMSEVGLVYIDGRLSNLIAPGESCLVWTICGDVQVKREAISVNPTLNDALLDEITLFGMNSADRLIRSEDVKKDKAPVYTASVPKHYFGLLFVDGELREVLEAGEYGFWQLREKIQVKTFNSNNVLLDSTQTVNGMELNRQTLVQLREESSALQAYTELLKVSTSEVGLLYIDGRLEKLIAPGESCLVWKACGDISLTCLTLDEGLQLPVSLLQEVEMFGLNAREHTVINTSRSELREPVHVVSIPHQHTGLLFVDGVFQDALTPGKYGFWHWHQQVEVKVFDCRQQLVEVSGQEILTKDRVSLRINLTAGYQVVDPVVVAREVVSVGDVMYKALQLALREAVGMRTLDELLLDRLAIRESVMSSVMAEMARVGISLNQVGVKDIILPGEMRTILNQVVEAQKSAEANVIRRREETAATRSLHNTAKMIENNPTLLRLKELEALEKVAEKIDKLTVYGGLEGLMNDSVKLAV